MYSARRALTATASAGVVAAGVLAAGLVGGAQAGVAGRSTGSAATGSSVAAAKALTATQTAFPLPLIVRGDRVQLRYEARNVPLVTGTLFVRNDRERRFTLLPLTHRRITSLTASSKPLTWLTAVVPDRLIRGQRLLYYAVIRDSRTGRSVTVPPTGARGPETTLIINGAFRVSLGTHVFGHPQAPEAVVARAGPTEVGFGKNGLVFGPSSIDVAKDHSLWLLDEVNRRMLAWAPGHPDAVARMVTLPFSSDEFGVGPAGSVYLMRGGLPGSPFRRLTRLSASGKVLWTSRIAGGLWLRTGPDGTLYSTGPGPEPSPRTQSGAYPWVPVATPGGRPLSLPAQEQRTQWAQPLPGGLQLARVPTGYDRQSAPHEARVALINRAGRVVRSWRISSRTVIWMPWGVTPALVGGDPVIVLTATAPSGNPQEYLVLRLGPSGGIRTRFALPLHDPPRSAYGDSVITDIRVESDAKLYQLGSSPDTGAAINRFSLRRTR